MLGQVYSKIDRTGYVLKVGLEKGDKTPHELLIKSVAETRCGGAGGRSVKAKLSPSSVRGVYSSLRLWCQSSCRSRQPWRSIRWEFARRVVFAKGQTCDVIV